LPDKGGKITLLLNFVTFSAHWLVGEWKNSFFGLGRRQSRISEKRPLKAAKETLTRLLRKGRKE
jgi:hypothetical protein